MRRNKTVLVWFTPLCCPEIAKNGGIAIISAIAPYASSRDAARQLTEDAGATFVEIWISTSIEECARYVAPPPPSAKLSFPWVSLSSFTHKTPFFTLLRATAVLVIAGAIPKVRCECLSIVFFDFQCFVIAFYVYILVFSLPYF